MVQLYDEFGTAGTVRAGAGAFLQPRAAVWGASKSLLIVPRSLDESEGPSTDRKWRAFPGSDGLPAAHGAQEDEGRSKLLAVERHPQTTDTSP